MESQGSPEIALLAPAQVRFKAAKLKGNKGLEIIDVHLEGVSSLAKDPSRVFPKHLHPFRVCSEKRPIPMFLKAGATQWGIVLHIVSGVPHQIPLNPDSAIDIRGIRVL